MGQSDFSDVFISYRRHDVEFVKKLVADLQAAGKEVWVDWEDIAPGSVGFSDDIRRGLEGADAFIAVLTPEYLESSYCIDLELRYAVDLKKKVIPIVLRKFDAPPPDGIGHINWIYFTPHAGHENTYDEAYPKVVFALEQDLAHARMHKRLGLRAIEWDRQSRANSFLLGGDELAQAEQWLVSSVDKDPDPTELHIEYITESRALSNRRQRQIMAAISTALVISIILTLLSVVFFLQARANEREANQNEQIAYTAQAQAVSAKATAELNEQIAVVERERAEQSAQLSQALVLSIESFNAVETDQVKAIALGVRSVAGDLLPDGIRRSVSQVLYMPGPKVEYDVVQSPPTETLSADGSWLVAMDQAVTNQVFVYDVPTSDLLQEIVLTEGNVRAVASAPTEDWLAIGTSLGAVEIWNVRTGEQVAAFWIDSEIGITSVTFSYDSARVAAGDEVGNIGIWNISTGNVVASWLAEDSVILAMDFSPDGNLLAAGSLERTSIWDIQSQELFQEFPSEGLTRIIRFSPGNDMVVVGEQFAVLMYSVRDRRSLGRFTFEADLGALNFDPDGNRLAIATFDRRIQLFNLETGKPEMRLAGHLAGLVAANYVDEHTLFTAASDGSVVEWDLRDGRKLVSSSDRVMSVFSRDSRQVVSITRNGDIVIEDVITDAEVDRVQDRDIAGMTDPPDSLAFGADENTLIIMSEGGEVGIWNIEARSFDAVYGIHTDELSSFKVSADGLSMLSASWDGTTRYWDISTGDVIYELATAGRVTDVALSQEAGLAVTISEPDGVIQFWDLETGTEVTGDIGNPSRWDDPYEQAAFSSDGQHIFVAEAGDHHIRMFDLQTGELVREFVGAQDRINDMHLSEDGATIVVGGFDQHVRFWDVESAEMIREFAAEDLVTHVEFSADGKKAISNSFEQLVVWRVDTLNELVEWANANRFVRDLTCDELERYNLQTTDADCA